MKRILRVPTPVLGLAVAGGLYLLAPLSASAQQPLIDAGNQAMLMHQGDLLEQQTAPNNGIGETGTPPKPPKLTLEQRKQQLRIEYNARLARDGKPAADTWLQHEATALGREYGEAIRRKP